MLKMLTLQLVFCVLTVVILQKYWHFFLKNGNFFETGPFFPENCQVFEIDNFFLKIDNSFSKLIFFQNWYFFFLKIDNFFLKLLIFSKN